MKQKIKRSVWACLLTVLLIGGVIAGEKKMRPYLFMQMEAETIQALNEEIAFIIQDLNIPNDLFQDQSLDVAKTNALLAEALHLLNENIKKEQLIAGIPIGNFVPMTFFHSKGTKISFTMHRNEKIQGTISFQTESLGINNVLIRVTLDIVLHGELYLGFYHHPFTYHQQLPLAAELFMGEVPSVFPYGA